MTDLFSIVSLGVSIIVALAVVYREFIHGWRIRLRLEVEFSLEDPISRETIVRGTKGESGQMVWLKAFWPRLRITNRGRSVAQKCEGILAEVRNPDGALDKRFDPLKLRWAIAPISRGLEPLDIARNRVVDLNTFTTVEGRRDASFATYPDPIGTPLSLAPGDHWLCIVIYGDNFTPVRRGYAVQWDGKDYKRGVHMKEMDDAPTSSTAWPWEKIEKAQQA